MCPFISGTRVRYCGELFFFLLFFFSSPPSPRLAFLFFPSFFCLPLLSFSTFLPSFFLSTILFPFVCFLFLLLVSPFLLLFFLSFLPLFYFPDFFLLFLSLSHSFFFFLRSHKMTTFCGLYIAMTDQTGFWSTILADYVFCLILYTVLLLLLLLSRHLLDLSKSHISVKVSRRTSVTCWTRIPNITYSTTSRWTQLSHTITTPNNHYTHWQQLHSLTLQYNNYIYIYIYISYIIVIPWLLRDYHWCLSW